MDLLERTRLRLHQLKAMAIIDALASAARNDGALVELKEAAKDLLSIEYAYMSLPSPKLFFCIVFADIREVTQCGTGVLAVVSDVGRDSEGHRGGASD